MIIGTSTLAYRTMKALAQLYLDTARLGRMRPSAQLAVQDFASFFGEDSFGLYGFQFFKHGICDWPVHLRDSFAGLNDWHGVGHLKQSLRHLVNAPAETSCLLASRSTTLMRAAAKLMATRCRRVLIVDLSWTPYVSLVRRVLRQSRAKWTMMPLRHAALNGCISAQDAIDLIASQFAWHECDGILIPAVSHDGVRLPVDSIIRAVRAVRPFAFVVVDGAQALGHVPDQLGVGNADVFIGGTHKWMEGGMPLGIAFTSPEASSQLQASPPRDPLLQFTSSVEEGSSFAGTETVNVWPLISCQGALTSIGSADQVETAFISRRRNSSRVASWLAGSDWQAAETHNALRSGIDLFRLRPLGRECECHAWRTWLQACGISVSVYRGPVVRLSMPEDFLSESTLDTLRTAFNGKPFRQTNGRMNWNWFNP